MSRPRGGVSAVVAAVWVSLLAPLSAFAGPLRVSNLIVTNSDKTVLVNAVLLGSLPSPVVEGLGTGIPAAVRFQVEFWQYNPWWVDRRVAARIVERQVLYDVLTKEYRVSALQGEEREPYVTRDLWEAERVLSQVRNLPLVPISSLKIEDLYYVRIRAEVRSAPDSSFSRIVPLLSSRVETSWEQSPLLTVNRAR
jgi:hypothetical protein